MPIAALCPQCSGPLSDAAVVALAPVCKYCNAVLTVVGGSLGLTGVYGVNDSTFTRQRVAADLALHREYRQKYEGAIEHCKQSLRHPAEHYAKLPAKPQILPLEPFVTDWTIKFWWLYFGYLLPVLVLASQNVATTGSMFGSIGVFLTLCPVVNLLVLILALLFNALGCLLAKLNGFLLREHGWFIEFFLLWTVLGAFLSVCITMWRNGLRPVENARRMRIHAEACAAAVEAAEPLKKAEDHRLRCQIRECEALIRTVSANEEKLQQLLAKCR